MKRLFLLLVLLGGCQDNEADAPELETKPAQQIGSTSVVMEADIRAVGPIRPIKYGFLWDTQGSDLTLASAPNKNITGTTSSPQPYSIKVETLLPATTYYYRSFAANNDFTRIYYGAVVSFTTLP